MRASFLERQHDMKWREDHFREMSLVLALQRVGYSRTESHRMAERHRLGEHLLANHNGGPSLYKETP